MRAPGPRGRPGAALAALIVAALALAVLVIVVLGARMRTAVGDLESNLAALQALDAAGETLVELAGEDAVAEWNRLSGVGLPGAAANVWLGRAGRTEPAYWLRVDAAPADALAFAGALCPGAVRAGYNPAFAYAAPEQAVNFDWWRPDDAARFSGAECRVGSRAAARILLDQTDAARAVVYVELGTAPP